jgi:hypothetical protein
VLQEIQLPPVKVRYILDGPQDHTVRAYRSILAGGCGKYNRRGMDGCKCDDKNSVSQIFGRTFDSLSCIHEILKNVILRLVYRI